MRMRVVGSRPLLAAGGALILLLAGGCSRIQEHQGFIIEPLIVGSVAVGVDNKDSVARSMGRPTFTSQFGPERWYYISRYTKQLSFSTPRPVQQEMYVIEFDKAGNVASVTGDRSLEHVANLSPSGDKTPTLGRKRSLFDEIFGNIGAVGAGGLGGGGGADQGGGGQGPNGG